MLTLHQLNSIEEIKQLKARYLRFGDTQQWDQWRGCFTEDVSAVFQGTPRAGPNDVDHYKVHGIDNLVDTTASVMTTIKSAHQCCMSEIAITGEDTATGIWAVHDYLILPQCVFRGWGHYHEKYRKVEEKWKICSIELTRIRVEEEWL